MKIKRISIYKEFTECKDSWDELVSRSNADNIFLTYDWIDGVIRHFYKDASLLILNVFDDEKLVGIAPLVIRKYRYFGLQVKAVCFIGTIYSDRMDFIMDGDGKKALGLILDYLETIKEEWDFIDLQEILDGTGTSETIETWLKDKRYMNILGPSSKVFFMDLNGKDRDAKQKKFSKKFNREFKQAKNRGLGLELDFKRQRDKIAEPGRFFSDICRVEGDSWQGKEKKGIFSKQATRDFHKEMFSVFAEKGWVDLSILKLDGRTIAYMYDYCYGKMIYSYNASFDRRYSCFSPGTMLMLWILKDSIERGIPELDFLRGEEGWKKNLTKTFKTHNRIRIFRDTFYSGCLYLLYLKIMPFLKKSRFLHRAWMKTKEMLDGSKV
ncbi:MAG: GNAT family N-acetyltransferase [Candidatus Gorgyraea atricola]|nr:GNAT family N-acetyltransferase [Candidatus Gorgyraea atricola]